MISGRVQGVGYRYSLERVAAGRGVSGWCRNTSDGSVEALFCGERAAIESLIDWCRQGPDFASVNAVAIDWQQASGSYKDFSILR
jgi:acylphosphatase